MFLVDWPGGSWQATATFVVATIVVYVGAMWLALTFWAYRDARRRSRSAAFQVSAVVLVALFFIPGLWLYLLLRPRLTLTQQYAAALEEEALLQELDDVLACPSCNRRVREEYLLCPSCLFELKIPCASCEKPLAHAWLACPFCGKRRATRTATVAAAATDGRPLQQEEVPALAPPVPSGVPVGSAGG